MSGPIYQALTREVYDLRAENERLRAENDHLRQARSDALAGGDVLREEIARLRARVEELEYGNSKAMAALAALAGVQDVGPP